MSPEEFVGRLDKVRKSGTGRWMAICPAHEDRSPSLAVGTGNDGNILIKCFAGCEPDEILGALGLEISDLFADPHKNSKSSRYPLSDGTHVPKSDILAMLRTETMIVWLAGCDMAKGKILSDVEKARLDLSSARIEAAING